LGSYKNQGSRQPTVGNQTAIAIAVPFLVMATMRPRSQGEGCDMYASL
jgi:hypothetical protein